MTVLNLSDQIVHLLGKQIIQGVLKPGVILPKVENLAEEYGVSRTVIREALKGLIVRRLLKSVPKIGTIICPRHEWQWWDPEMLTWASESNPNRVFLLQLIEIRIAIEPVAAELAAQKATESNKIELRASYELLEQSLGNAEAWAKADYEFHNCILAASKNELMLNLIVLLRNALLQGRQATIGEYLKENPANPAALESHKLVMEAICQNNGFLARQRMMDVLLVISKLVENIKE